MCVILFGGQLLAQQSPQLTSSLHSKDGKALLFRHPKLGYMVAIPPDTVFENRQDIDGISIKSRKGYLITLQTGIAKTGTPLPELLTSLEQIYLGKGRPWSRKLGEKSTSLAGLKAFEATYEGAGTKVRVIVARGSFLDYAFIFIAPPKDFTKFFAHFNWVLQSFRPSTKIVGDGVKRKQVDGLDEMMRGDVHHLKSDKLGFSIDFPNSWAAQESDAPLVTISGKKGSEAFFATINIQNVLTSHKTTDITMATQLVVTDLKRQLRNADPQVRFPGQGAYIYSQNGLKLHGLQFYVVYERDGEKFQQWNVVLPRPDDSIVHVWSYAAPKDRYERFGAIASKILETWKLNLER